MSDRLVTLTSFASPPEARIAASQLEAAGIPAHLDGELVGSTLFHVGTALGGVKLQVAEHDVPRAREVLDLIQEGPADRTPWTCPHCGTEVEHGFEVCWSCGGSRTEPPTAPAAETPPEAQTTCPMCGAAHPASQSTCPNCGEDTHEEKSFVPARAPADYDEPSPARDALTRAWRAAILGIGLCPGVLHFYSLFQLLEFYRLRSSDGHDDDWRATATLLIDGAMIAGAAVVWMMLR